MATSTSTFRTSPTSSSTYRQGAAGEARAPARRGALAGPIALAALVVVYLALAAFPATAASRLVPATAGGSPDWLLGPLRPLGLESASRPSAGPLFYAGLWLALVAYAVAVTRARDIPHRAAIAALGGLVLVFFTAPPLLSQDAFSYLAYARLDAVHGLDPHVAAPVAIPGDAIFRFAGSKDAASVYGPPFTLVSSLLAGASVAGAFWALKAVAAACTLGAVALVWRAAERRGLDPRAPALLVGLNPALLVHVVGAAHNEAVTVLALAGALLAFSVRREVASGALATAATAIKASAALPVPFLVAGARRRGRSARAALAAAGVALAVVAVGLAGYGADSLGWIDGIASNQARTSSFSLPYKTAELLGAILPGERLDYRAGARIAYALAFGGVAAWLLWRTWRGADTIAMAGWATLALLLCSAWLVPWYVAWLLPLAALGASRRLRVAAVGLTAWTLAIAIPF